MKKIVTYLFIVFLATLVFYGGAGVNLVTYCCGDCRMEGVTVLLENKCCEMHGQIGVRIKMAAVAMSSMSVSIGMFFTVICSICNLWQLI